MRIRRRKKDPPEHPEADRALQEADQHYEEVISREKEVKKISKQARHMQKRNHFSERIEAIMEGREYRGE